MTVPPFLAKWGIHIAIALACVGLLVLAYCSGEDAGKTGERAAQQEQTIAIQKKAGEAGDKAADERVQQTTTLQQQKQELDNARTTPPPPGMSARTRRNCIRMRQQGQDIDRVPACRGLEGQR